MKYAVAIVFRGQREALMRCLASVVESSPKGETQVLLWANASEDIELAPDAKRLVEAAGFLCAMHVSAVNVGFSGPVNRLLGEAGTNYFVCLNSDAVVGPGWLEALEAPFNRHARVGLTGPRGGCRQILETGHGVPGERLDYIEGSCFMIPTALFRKMGGFDTETYHFAYSEDADICLRLRERGWKLCEVDVPGFTHSRGLTREAVLADPNSPDLRGYEVINNARLLTRWADYLKRGTFARTIVLERKAAMGDCLWLSALARIVAHRVPNWKLYARTPYPELFENNPLIYPVTGPLREPVETVNLDGAYESRPHMHISLAYAEALGVPGFVEPIGPQMVVTASEELENSRLNPGRYIIVHSGRVGWKGRDLPPETWAEIRDDLAREFPERQVLCIDRGWPEELRRSAALIAGADLFVGPDSFPATLAYATGAPAVVLFGSINPRWRLPPTGSFRSVQARGLECLGCHHELPAPRVFTDCPREPEADYAPCMDNIDPEQVTMAAKAVIRKVENAVEIV